MIDGRNVKIIMDNTLDNSCLGQLHLVGQTADDTKVDHCLDAIDRNEQLGGCCGSNLTGTTVDNIQLIGGHNILINLEAELLDLLCGLTILAQDRANLNGDKHTDFFHHHQSPLSIYFCFQYFTRKAFH